MNAAQLCYGCLFDVDVRKQDGRFILKRSTLMRIRPIILLGNMEFSLTLSGSTDFRLNIYGPADQRGLVGNLLGDDKVYLQQPATIRKGIVYDNPQWLYAPGEQRDLTRYVKYDGQELESWTSMAIQEMIDYQETRLCECLRSGFCDSHAPR
ncbi:hypothetical protein EDB81DRAFT_761623 [Dactylonectria macrodidyma]|uniref:Uncharacterized protein n=1 Tax=Dactylonectria macrodidyma TaxID=307937 RepID=A0A9P9IVY2_9HYPO|nr:hypothetical protein EDB81DRAFT_761623 [Dactylonectria macrodidyma]